MAQEPLVDRLADNLGESAEVLRVSIHTEIGRELGRRYGLRVVPSFVIFDGVGQEAWRGNIIPSKEKVLGQESP